MWHMLKEPSPVHIWLEEPLDWETVLVYLTTFLHLRTVALYWFFIVKKFIHKFWSFDIYLLVRMIFLTRLTPTRKYWFCVRKINNSFKNFTNENYCFRICTYWNEHLFCEFYLFRLLRCIITLFELYIKFK